MRDEILIETLFREHRKRLFRQIVKIVGCPETAEELVQEAFVRIVGAFRKEDVAFKEAFLYRTGHNLAIDHIRKEQCKSRYLETRKSLTDMNYVSSNSTSPEENVSGKENWAEFSRSLDELPQRMRRIFLLKQLKGMSYPQISKLMGLSESTIYTDFKAGMKHCLKKRNAI